MATPPSPLRKEGKGEGVWDSEFWELRSIWDLVLALYHIFERIVLMKTRWCLIENGPLQWLFQ